VESEIRGEPSSTPYDKIGDVGALQTCILEVLRQ
jgi:hypothetical protein